MRAELLPPGGKRKERTPEQIAAVAATEFDFPATQVGTVGNITVYYDSDLGPPGLSLATQMLNVVTAPYNDMQNFFGIAGGTVQVIIAPLSGNNDGSGGAFHQGCDFTAAGALYLDATFANPAADPLNLEVGLYVAELSESFMGPQGGGWGCGFSNGEGCPASAPSRKRRQARWMRSPQDRRGRKQVSRTGLLKPSRPTEGPCRPAAPSFTSTGCARSGPRFRRSSRQLARRCRPTTRP